MLDLLSTVPSTSFSTNTFQSNTKSIDYESTNLSPQNRSCGFAYSRFTISPFLAVAQEEGEEPQSTSRKSEEFFDFTMFPTPRMAGQQLRQG